MVIEKDSYYIRLMIIRSKHYINQLTHRKPNLKKIEVVILKYFGGRGGNSRDDGGKSCFDVLVNEYEYLDIIDPEEDLPDS